MISKVVIVGDEYTRGEILVELNRRHKKAGNDCGNELGDYLPNILNLLSKLNDEEDEHEIVNKLLRPALDKMITNFVSKEDKQINVYRFCIETIKVILENDYSNTNNISFCEV